MVLLKNCRKTSLLFPSCECRRGRGYCGRRREYAVVRERTRRGGVVRRFPVCADRGNGQCKGNGRREDRRPCALRFFRGNGRRRREFRAGARGRGRAGQEGKWWQRAGLRRKNGRWLAARERCPVRPSHRRVCKYKP